jgi:biotin carboxyl carrier protein
MSTNEVLDKKEVENDCEKQKIRCKSLNVMGTKYRTTLTKKYENRKKWEAENLSVIASVIPGKVLEIKVKEGDSVKEGETVLILEAMKMYNRILMPFSGKIKSFNVKEGDVIPKNHVMFEVE